MKAYVVVCRENFGNFPKKHSLLFVPRSFLIGYLRSIHSMEFADHPLFTTDSEVLNEMEGMIKEGFRLSSVKEVEVQIKDVEMVKVFIENCQSSLENLKEGLLKFQPQKEKKQE